jgi:hypothetical protein
MMTTAGAAVHAQTNKLRTFLFLLSLLRACCAMADHGDTADLNDVPHLLRPLADLQLGVHADLEPAATLDQAREERQGPPSIPVEPSAADAASVLSGADEGELETNSLCSSVDGPSPALASLFGDATAPAAAVGAPGEPAGAAQPRPPAAAASLPPPWPAQAAEGSSAAATAASAGADAAAAAGLWHYPKHIFVFSSAGKPVFSLHGDENELAGLMATAQAIMSVVQGGGQQLKHLRQGAPVRQLPRLGRGG